MIVMSLGQGRKVANNFYFALLHKVTADLQRFLQVMEQAIQAVFNSRSFCY
jgi:hypothetical protein